MYLSNTTNSNTPIVRAPVLERTGTRRRRPDGLLWILCTVCALGTLTGCHEKAPEVAWTAAPRVGWDRIATQSFERPEDGFLIIPSAPTSGLFPANISVSRLAFEEDHESSSAPLYLLRDPRNEFLQWNTAFDDQMAISEVFPIAQRDLGGGEVTPERIVAATQALGGRLGLIYAVNDLSKSEAEMLGALYETSNYRPLAAIRTTAVSIDDDDMDDSEKVDPFETESRALVRSKFETLMRACIRELIAADEQAEIETPDGWKPDPRFFPVEWPPLLNRAPEQNP